MSHSDKEFCKQAPHVYNSFVDVIFDHAVGKQILGPTKNPCPTFFSRPQRGDVWNDKNWGRYPDPDMVVSHLPAPKRLVAIGDLHGDLKQTRRVLNLSKLLTKDDKWAGGESMLVQVGDIFDRGRDELKICYLLEKLKRDAARKGGAVHVLHGNHETLNMSASYVYTRREGFLEFHDWMLWWHIQEGMRKMVEGCPLKMNYFKGLPKWNEVAIMNDKISKVSPFYTGVVGRTLAMRPGGPVSKRFFGNNPTILVVGKSVFVHAGIRPEVVTRGMRDVIDYNKQVCNWVKGLSGLRPPKIVECGSKPGPKLPVTWNREWGMEEGDLPCDELKKTLAQLQTSRMLIGHTIQTKKGLNAACQGRVIRIDVGLSRGCGGHPPQSLEILNDEILKVLSKDNTKSLSVSIDIDDELNEAFMSDAESGEGSQSEAQEMDWHDARSEPDETDESRGSDSEKKKKKKKKKEKGKKK